jgi:hypothetical protein
LVPSLGKISIVGYKNHAAERLPKRVCGNLSGRSGIAFFSKNPADQDGFSPTGRLCLVDFLPEPEL